MDLIIKDFKNKEVRLRPSVGLYSVKDFMGKDLHGLAILLDEVNHSGKLAGPYGVLTVSFGEFIGLKNCAYIDTNNCPFADQILSTGIAEQTPYYKTSGFCKYPLWQFKESFLQEIGGDIYQTYSDSYDAYMPKPVPVQDNSQAIQEFSKKASPFYIVDHEDGTFALCLPFSFCEDDMVKNCQKAFDDYAESTGIPAIDKHGLHTHGNGHDWEEVFRQAFKEDPQLQKIDFDSEAGAFFCNANDLEVLTDLGSRFYDICNQPGQFAALLPPAMELREKRYVWAKEDVSTYASIRDFLQKNPGATITAFTPEGLTKLGPTETRLILSDEATVLSVGDDEFLAKWLLDQAVGMIERNAADSNAVHVETLDYSMKFHHVMSM